MKDVWIINLIDNRNSNAKTDDKKFNFCLSEGIIGIGWGNTNSRVGIGYTRATNGINGMSIGDLVWTKNPKTKTEYYLFRVIDDPVDHGILNHTKYVNNDIGESRKVELVEQFTEHELHIKIPNISKKDIVARSTVQNVHIDRVVNATNDYVAHL